MDIGILREYIEFSKYLNFSAAARSLHMSQSSLSKHMLDLEKSLGFSLIERGKQPILTPAGKAYLEAAEDMLFHYDRALERCREIDRGIEGRLVIQDPVMDATIANQTISVFTYFSQHHPSIEIHLQPLKNFTISEALKEGVVDLGYYMAYGDEDEIIEAKRREGIEMFVLRHRKFAVWLRKDHPCANKEKLYVADLKDSPFLLPSDRLFDGWRIVLEGLAESCGFTPKFRLCVKPTINGYFAINTQDGAVILSEAFLRDPRFLMREDMVTREFADENCEHILFAAYHADNTNPALPAFVEHLKMQCE